jgi:hypothetical protein
VVHLPVFDEGVPVAVDRDGALLAHERCVKGSIGFHYLLFPKSCVYFFFSTRFMSQKVMPVEKASAPRRSRIVESFPNIKARKQTTKSVTNSTVSM